MASSKDPTLSLNLGFSPSPPPTTNTHNPLPDSDFKLSLTLTLSSSVADHHHNQPATSPRSAVSSLSLSNGSAGVPTVNRRRQRDQTATTVPATSGTASQEVDAFRHNNYSSKSVAASDDEDEDLATHSNVRKKLRLTKDQSALLEESFKLHSTLNPKQKLALANRLNLRPRQVEVWFQNRRARTKLKQTEVDCELLKKWCESLTNENRRLQKEVQELRSLKTRGQAPFYMQLPAATLSMCPSCERINGGAELRRR